jgi:hypothetical protein
MKEEVKTEVKEVKEVEEVELTFKEKLESQINILKSELKKIEQDYAKIIGALNATEGILKEYENEK